MPCAARGNDIWKPCSELQGIIKLNESLLNLPLFLKTRSDFIKGLPRALGLLPMTWRDCDTVSEGEDKGGGEKNETRSVRLQGRLLKGLSGRRVMSENTPSR